MMRKIAVVLVTILLLAFTTSGLGCGNNEPGPEDTVHQMFKALEAGDFQKAVSYTTIEQPEWLLEKQQEMFKSVDIENLILKTISESENEAILEAEYDIEFTVYVYNEFTTKQHNTMTVKLVRVDDRWLISDIIQSDALSS